MLNLSYLALRQVQAVLLLGENSSQKLLKFVKENIPENSRIVGDEVFFYVAAQIQAEFEICRWKLDIEEREKLHREIFDYEYFMTSYPLSEGHPFFLYHKNSALRALDTFLLERKQTKLLVNLFHVDRSDLNCIIWKRIPEKDKSN